MKTIPKLDPILFSEGNHLRKPITAELNLDSTDLESFISDHVVGYTFDDEGDPMIMFEVDGHLFWGDYFRSILSHFNLKLG